MNTALFHHYDDASRGYLDRGEFRNLLNDLRSRMPFLEEEDLVYFMAEADGDENKQIFEYDEFMPVAPQILQTMHYTAMY